MIKFREKNFTQSVGSRLINSTAKGATIGASLASIGVPFYKSSLPKETSSKDAWLRSGKLIATGAITGAALGLLIEGIKVSAEKLGRKKELSKSLNLMRQVVSDLQKAGFREGKDFTLDPNEADRLSCRACLAITRSSGNLKIIINSAREPHLQEVARQIERNLPSTGVVTQKKSDKFNELVFTTISDSPTDIGLVGGIAERIIRSGYPVYLIEVG